MITTTTSSNPIFYLRLRRAIRQNVFKILPARTVGQLEFCKAGWSKAHKASNL